VPRTALAQEQLRGDPIPSPSPLRVDYVGFVLVALGFGALQIMLDRYERDDGLSSGFITSLGLIAAVSLAILVIWEALHPQPVMDVKLLRSSAFAISCVVMFAFGCMIVSTTQLLPQLSQTLLNHDAANAGLTLGLGGVATLLFMPISGDITGRLVQPKWLILMSLVGTGLALVSSARLDLDIGFRNISMVRIAQVIWLPFLFIPLSAVSYVGVPPKQTNEASALINQMRNLGGSVGVSFTPTMLEERTQFHHARLAEHITAYNGYAWPAPLAPIDEVVQAQASIMSYSTSSG
jgi:DHA2 family multidrug resistance protein